MNKLALKRSVSAVASLLGPFSNAKADGPGLRILNYHSITDALASGDNYQMTTPRELFDAQMLFLKDGGYRVISCLEAAARIGLRAGLPEKAVCLTFDDGFKDNVVNALPVLRKHGFEATIFLTAGFIGKGRPYLEWSDAERLRDSGLFSFGAHTLSHRKLTALTADEAKDEIVSSKKALEERLNVPVDIFAYPFGYYGSFDEKSVAAVKAGGYKAAVTTIAGSNDYRSDPYLLRRTRISWQDDEREFSRQLSGAYDWYRLWQKIGSMSR